MKIPFAQIDAFADTAFAGNPAAVMTLSAWLPDAVMQAIAGENNLSETAFLVPATDGDANYDLRWFTPGAEVQLCGHATLASGHHVLSADPALNRVRFRTRYSGMLTVARAGADYTLDLPAWPSLPSVMPGVVAALGIVDPVAVLSQDKGYVLVIVADEAIVRTLDPDLRALAAEGPLVAIVSAPGAETDIVSRVFTPAYAIDEDPVTGSAHAVMVPYWAERLGRTEMTAYQASLRGGRLTCRLVGDRVILGGACVTVIEGVFLLP